jgi:membrane-bound serine protease (ClpP class)
MLSLIIVLVLLGLVLIGIEIFIPGLIVGAIGALALLAAVVLTYREFGSGPGDVMLIALVVLGGAFICWWLSWLPRSYVGRRWTLHAAVEGPTETPNFSALLGASGRALTPLRPGGMALIDGRRVDVVAESGFVEAGEEVTVLRAEGAKVLVRRVAAAVV